MFTCVRTSQGPSATRVYKWCNQRHLSLKQQHNLAMNNRPRERKPGSHSSGDSFVRPQMLRSSFPLGFVAQCVADSTPPPTHTHTHTQYDMSTKYIRHCTQNIRWCYHMKHIAENPEDMALLLFMFPILILHTTILYRKLLHSSDHCI